MFYAPGVSTYTIPNRRQRFPYDHSLTSVSSEMRGTGMLDPLKLGNFPFVDFQPWHARVIEPDVLMGRRGVAGWNGQDHDIGLWLTTDFPVPSGRLKSLAARTETTGNCPLELPARATATSRS